MCAVALSMKSCGLGLQPSPEAPWLCADLQLLHLHNGYKNTATLCWLKGWLSLFLQVPSPLILSVFGECEFRPFLSWLYPWLALLLWLLQPSLSLLWLPKVFSPLSGDFNFRRHHRRLELSCTLARVLCFAAAIGSLLAPSIHLTTNFMFFLGLSWVPCQLSSPSLWRPSSLVCL